MNSPKEEMNNSLLDEYNGYHPEFMDSLTIFPEDIRKKLIKRLKDEKDRNNFLSTVVEIRFGKLFSELGFQLEYDKRFSNNQRPDWLIKLGNSTALCDVYRLGKSEKDQIRSEFENRLIEKIQKIPKNSLLKISFLNEYFDTTKYNIDLITIEVKDWLLGSPKEIGERISVLDNFEFKILKSNTNTPHVTCLGNANSIDIKPQKIKQLETLKPNEITKKLHKYDAIISENNMPYFICVYIDFVSGFDHNELKENFLGHGVEFGDFGTPIANEQFSHLGQEWTELGEFYNNLQLSGLITFYNEKFQLLLNPCKGQIIYDERNLQVLTVLKTIPPDTDTEWGE